MAVRAQLLDAERPTDLLDVVAHLTFLQHDQTTAVAPSQHVVLWSRLGSGYDREELTAALEQQQLVELDGLLRPVDDLVLHRDAMAHWPGPEPRKPWQHELADWVAANDGARRELLEVLRTDGPLPARELPDSCAVPWRSSGWTNHKNVQKLLDLMAGRGEVAVVGRGGRGGRDRLWDLASRVYPDEPALPEAEAALERSRRRLRALGLARSRAPVTPNEPDDVGAVGLPAVVEGVAGAWRLDPDLAARLDEPFAGRAALLSPLDRLVFDRRRMAELFDFDYQLEMYKPAASRRWGYWALPVLAGDRLVGKLDATAEPTEGELVVHALHEDEPWAGETRAAVEAQVQDLGRWLGLAVVREG